MLTRTLTPWHDAAGAHDRTGGSRPGAWHCRCGRRDSWSSGARGPADL